MAGISLVEQTNNMNCLTPAGDNLHLRKILSVMLRGHLAHLFLPKWVDSSVTGACNIFEMEHVIIPEVTLFPSHLPSRA